MSVVGMVKGDIEVGMAGSGSGVVDDLFELVWQVGKGGARGQPTLSSLQSPPHQVSAKPLMTLDPPPPSEDVMAGWLYAIVSGHNDDGEQPVAKVASDTSTVDMGRSSVGTMTAESKAKLQEMDRVPGTKDTNTWSDSDEKKASGSGSTSRNGSSHHSGSHSLTEKKRRCKIKETLRTLQQLVPGCDKSNQASTLDQTIQHMKSLQKQVQAMYPVAVPMPPTVASVAPGTGIAPAAMVPFRAMLPYPHYHAMMMPAVASPTPQYPSAPAGAFAAAASPGSTGDHAQSSAFVKQQQHLHSKEKGSRRL